MTLLAIIPTLGHQAEDRSAGFTKMSFIGKDEFEFFRNDSELLLNDKILPKGLAPFKASLLLAALSHFFFFFGTVSQPH